MDELVLARPETRLAYRVPDAAKQLGVGKSKMWALISEGRIETQKIDGATIVLHSSLEAFLAKKRDQSSIK